MQKAPSNETKKGRFKRLATLRTNEVLRSLKVLGNCANRSAYEYNEEDIRKIFSELDRRLKGVKAKFHFLGYKKFKL